MLTYAITTAESSVFLQLDFEQAFEAKFLQWLSVEGYQSTYTAAGRQLPKDGWAKIEQWLKSQGCKARSLIKTGSIVLYIGGRGDSDDDLIYFSVGIVGEPSCDPGRWLIDFSQRFFNCNIIDLVWLMDQTEEMRGMSILDILNKHGSIILAAALRRLKQIHLGG
jgi:hypothetical protein